jgi:hypothetical protein
VEFATKQEARNAMDAVQGTHLYGRRLVLEWAEQEGGLDELRAKTAAKYRGEEEGDVGAGAGGGTGAGADAELGDAAAAGGDGGGRPAKRQKRKN